jgi:hypothetical protein
MAYFQVALAGASKSRKGQSDEGMPEAADRQH